MEFAVLFFETGYNFIAEIGNLFKIRKAGPGD